MNEGELDDKGLEEAIEDEKCNRISEEGKADKESVDGNNTEAELAAAGSSEECEDISDSEVKVLLEGSTKESKMSIFSKDSEDSESNLREQHGEHKL